MVGYRRSGFRGGNELAAVGWGKAGDWGKTCGGMKDP